MEMFFLPFSFREFLRFRNIEWTPALLATPEVGIVLKAFDDYLRFGGFPELAGLVGEASNRRELGIKKGGILTYNQDGTRTYRGAKISLTPVWKWLLNATPRA